MKKSIMNSGVVVLAAVVLCGCRIIGVGPSDKELVKTTMADWKAALLAKNLDMLMATYSEGYVCRSFDNKDSLRDYMAKGLERGLDIIKVNIEDAEMVIKGDKSTFGLVEYVSDSNTWTIEFTLQKENGTWLIVSSKRHGERRS